MQYQTLIIDFPEKTVARVALNRPDAANALSTQMGLELKDFFVGLQEEPGACRAVILTGGGKHFCAGADLKERKGMSKEAWHAQHEALEGALESILDCALPVIAAVNGAAYGGGLELALACDFIYAAATAKFALTEVTLGIMPGLGGTQNLPRAIGPRRAKELALTGKAFSAGDAHGWGMVNRVSDNVVEESLTAARIIAANAPLSVRAIKQAMNEGMHLSLSEALACELRYYNTLLSSKDRREGINAFNEKRKPVFTGE